MYNKILFPVDGSENSKRAFQHVLSLSEKYGSEVILLHTYQMIGEIVNVLGEQVSYIEEVNESKTSNGEIIVRPFVDELRLRQIKFETMIIKGEADYEIVNLAEANQCSLIIVGNEGMKTWSRFFLGSVSENVAHHAKCPVLLIP